MFQRADERLLQYSAGTYSCRNPILESYERNARPRGVEASDTKGAPRQWLAQSSARHWRMLSSVHRRWRLPAFMIGLSGLTEALGQDVLCSSTRTITIRPHWGAIYIHRGANVLKCSIPDGLTKVRAAVTSFENECFPWCDHVDIWVGYGSWCQYLHQTPR